MHRRPLLGRSAGLDDEGPARRIRILFVLTSPVRGGVEEVVLSLLERLDRSQFEPALAAPGPLLEALRPDLEGLGVPTVVASETLRPGGLASLASFIRCFRPDIINPHLFRSTLVAAPLGKWLGVPRVVETYHGREAWRRGPLKRRFIVDRIVSRWVDRIIAVSEAARDFLIQSKRIPAEKVVVVPNGRDLSRYQPGRHRAAVRRELCLGPDIPVIGIVGRLEEQKGHAFALDALSAVVSEVPRVRLLLVGEGGLRKELTDRVRRLGLEDHVIFMGFRHDVPRLLDALDLLVLPSLYEGMPLTAIEAQAMARPVVATRVDGTSEVVQDGVTGRLVPPGDAAGLAEAILALLRDPWEADRMGRAGRARALFRFDLGLQVEATAAVYRQTLGAAEGMTCGS